MSRLKNLTKIICIADFVQIECMGPLYKKGQIYEISMRNEYMANGVYVMKGPYFDNKFEESEFKKHFITLAEWRDQQINSILDDE